MTTYELGLSPCPNDTFIFHALLHGCVPLEGLQLTPFFADVEALNHRCLARELPFSKISLGVISSIMEKYALLSSGAALGFGCGPLVVAKRPFSQEELRHARVAIPGFLTTANLLLSLTGQFGGERREMIFSDVMGAVEREETDLGVLIHEGRFTYERHGLVKIMDLGAWWEENMHLPLPLGAIVVRRDVPAKTAHAVELAIQKSLQYGWKHPEASRAFIKEHAQELADEVIGAHIKTFVTEYSADLGEKGREAIRILVEQASKMQGKTLPREGLFL